ncbi:MAG: N-succinylarginine dihydrolase [Myxococcota bacterium]|nr:N-succinylarginine dihydrolase [Myxococcota bacterium]
MATLEANFDGLVGPTHNYAGLSYGNVASTSHAGAVASPKKAALQGLAKMKALAALGLPQGVLPPQERPDVRLLHRLGFRGTDAEMIEKAAKSDPTLLAIASSASAMWTANAATVAPSLDTEDGKVHFTPANLIEKVHRAIEPETTRRVLRAIFAGPRFVVHDPLPAASSLGDEGAANHTRLGPEVGAPGVHLFVYGREGLRGDRPAPTRFPARQTLEASRAVARLHRLPEGRAVFAQQSPAVIDQGVFHNDVIAVGHERVLFFHEEAFLDEAALLETLERSVEGFTPVRVAAADVPVADAVRSYLFNSQLLRPPGWDAMLLVAPEECRETPTVKAWIDAHVGDGRPIREARFFDLRESMQNGGGPACLRLRVALTDEERAAVSPWIDDVHDALVRWVETHYRERLSADDLADPRLLDESRAALDALTGILGIGSVYPFQQNR